MKAYDFEYDGLSLRDMGYMICEFDSNGLQTIDNGSQIAFHTISTQNGSKYELTNSEYDRCLECTFQICKNPDDKNPLELSVEEFRFLSSWLNRKEFHKFKLLTDEYLELYFEASFQISKIELGGSIIGAQLTMNTNKPYACQETRVITIQNDRFDGEEFLIDTSDDEGYIYPRTEITIKQDGDLRIYNALEDRTTYIGNCVSGEVITMDYPLIQTSRKSHAIENDFNWNFFRIAGTFENRKNNLRISIPCSIKITYAPAAKTGL